MLARTKCATNKFADKGQLAPQADRLYTVTQMLIVTDTTAPYSRVKCVVLVAAVIASERGIGQHKTLVGLIGTQDCYRSRPTGTYRAPAPAKDL